MEKILFVIATPVYKENKVIGVLYGSYYNDKLAEFIDITSFNSEGYIDIFESSGQFVLKSSHTNAIVGASSNIYDIFKEASFDAGYSYKKYMKIQNIKRVDLFHINTKVKNVMQHTHQ